MAGHTVYVTGAGVSHASGIPTFRGEDGYWTIGSKNYTPEQMATRAMYQQQPEAFLTWYYQRFVKYRDCQPNSVHDFLADKSVITQNIDGLDKKAGNQSVIEIHGNIRSWTPFVPMEDTPDITPCPWDDVDTKALGTSLLSLFSIHSGERPALYQAMKPYVLLFDEIYSPLYRIDEALSRLSEARKIVFMGTSFSVNITQMALRIAATHRIPVAVVDPNPVQCDLPAMEYFTMTADQYVQKFG